MSGDGDSEHSLQKLQRLKFLPRLLGMPRFCAFMLHCISRLV
jgi:hypothetical protein